MQWPKNKKIRPTSVAVDLAARRYSVEEQASQPIAEATCPRRELELGLSNVAYQFVMVQDALSRVDTMLHLFNLSKTAIGIVGEDGAEGDDSCGRVLISYMRATTTTTDPLIAFGIDPAPTRLTALAPPPLNAFRAYVQSVLIHASKLSEVFETPQNRSDHQILANAFTSRFPHLMAPLPKELVAHIDRLIAHRTYFEDSESEDWPLPRIRSWTSKTVDQLISYLRTVDEDLCDKFETALTRHREEVIRYG
jgi:hypothetical protein